MHLCFISHSDLQAGNELSITQQNGTCSITNVISSCMQGFAFHLQVLCTARQVCTTHGDSGSSPEKMPKSGILCEFDHLGDAKRNVPWLLVANYSEFLKITV